MSFHVLAKFSVVYAEMLQLLGGGTSSPRLPTRAPSMDPAVSQTSGRALALPPSSTSNSAYGYVSKYFTVGYSNC